MRTRALRLRRDILEDERHRGTDLEHRVWSVHQAPYQAEILLRLQLDINQDEWDVEAQQEGLSHDSPRANRAGAVDGGEDKGRIGGAAVRAHDVRWVAERSAK